MNIKDYKLEPGYQSKNEATLNEYDAAVKTISEIMEDVSINGTPYKMNCFKAYQNFFDVCCREKQVVLNELKMWHESIESYVKLFSYDKSVVKKLTTISDAIENCFETFSYMLEGIKRVKEEYDEKLNEFEENKGYLSRNSNIEMRTYFLNTAKLFVNLANQMEDFVDDVIKPKIDLCDIICSMELDFNEAIMYHKINKKIETKEGEPGENN